VSELRNTELQILNYFFKALANDAKQEARPTLTPHVTGIVYDCLRRCYYSLTTPIDTIDLKGSIRTWIGRKLHETQIFPGGQMELELEWKEDGKTILTGRLDEFDGKIILDKKTTRRIPREPYPHHIKQVELYNLLLKKNFNQTAKYGAIMYMDVSDASVKVFVFLLNTNLSALENEVRRKYEVLEKSLKTGILPPRIIQQWEPGSVGVVCGYCPFYGRCWQEDYMDSFRVLFKPVG